MKRILLFLLFIVPVRLVAQSTLTANEAKGHIGERATVCGTVASTHYAGTSNGSPTLVNFERPYPNEPFMVLVWGEDLSKFTDRPATWEGKRVCATGTIESYRGTAEIIAKTPSQITFPAGQQSQPSQSSNCPSSDHYVNSAGQCVPRPVQSDKPPAGATAQCKDGSYSFSQSRRGTCSHHGGVAKWL